MKKKLTLTESQLVKVINRIVESYNDYADEDYVEVFFHYFRPWIKKDFEKADILIKKGYSVKYINDMVRHRQYEEEGFLEILWRSIKYKLIYI